MQNITIIQYILNLKNDNFKDLKINSNNTNYIYDEVRLSSNATIHGDHVINEILNFKILPKKQEENIVCLRLIAINS